LELLKQDTEISADEANKLTSLEAPIVLVQTSARMHQTLATTALAPGLDRLGVMLPYAPLLTIDCTGFW
jgi:hydrogenase maturation protein HypF